MKTVTVASCFHICLPLLLFSFLFPPSTYSYTTSKDATISALLNSSTDDLDLVAFLNSKSAQQDTLFTEAIQILESMKSSPSCNRIAATRLLMSCQSVDTSKGHSATDTSMLLDNIKSLYAARLAVCELTGAGAAIPPSCSPLQVSAKLRREAVKSVAGDRPGSKMVDSIPTAMLESCLKSLESRPQWWTSYSNSRQNAMVICQAARTEIEKEELLELHRAVAENTLKLNNGLQEALRNAAAESAQHRAFVQATDLMRSNLLSELEGAGSHARDLLATFLSEFETAIGFAVKSVVSILKGVETDTSILGKEIRNATGEVDRLQRSLRTVHEENLARNAELAQAQKREAQINHELALAMRSSLDSLLVQDMARLSESVQGFDSSLRWLAERLSLIYQMEHQILERLQSFEASLDESELKAEDLRKAQKLQAEALEAQSQAQEALVVNAKVAQALLERVTTNAANLEASMEEMASRFRDIPVIGGAIGTFSPWTIVALLFSFIAAQHPRSAAALLLLCSGPLLLALRFLY
ncbi:hypothetical protein M432DRAFT_617872 [Thermoascus aurantiacus ATCC 26904]